MARFYPPVDFSKPPVIEKAGDYAERKVLEALKELDHNWHIIHGITWRDFGHKDREYSGEADAFVFHPELGVLIIEVKGGGVKHEDGVWYYINAHDGSVKGEMNGSPCNQAFKSRHYYFKRLGKTSLGQGILRKTAFTYTAWFPDIEWNAPAPPEMPRNSYILDSRHLANPAKALRSILALSFPEAQPWTENESNLLLKSILPEINQTPLLGTVLADIGKNLSSLTKAQVDAFSMLKSFKRLLVKGCAGSGKTLLAVRLAQEHLQQGKRVLLTCFNKHLAAFLMSEFEGCTAIDILNFHELVRQRCVRHGIPYDVPKDNALLPDFFRNRCPELLEQTLSADSSRYDTIIVDEAFDFLETWWIALEGLGVEGCSLYAFYDTDQGIFNSLTEWQPPFNAEPFILGTNLRNTRPVGEFAARLGKLEQIPDFKVDNGPKPKVMPYADNKEQAALVLKLVNELTGKERIKPEDLVILSPYKPDGEHVGLGAMIENNKSRFTTSMSAKEGKVRVATIQSFKGLEADVIILCGIDGIIPACKPANLYVGASRARSMLYLLHHKDVFL